MAAAITSCAPCVLGAASSTLLSFPYDIIQSMSVEVVPRLSVINGSTSTIGLDTTTIANEIISTVPGPGSPPVATFTNPDQLTWSTLGTVLTWPTTYVEYLGFVGASATPSGCAQSVEPTALSLPGDVNAASLVFPEGGTNNGLPGGLLSYLDGLSGFTSQLGGPAESCPTPGGVVAPPPSATSNLSTSTSFTTVTSASTTVTESNSTITTLLSTSLSTSLTTLTSTLTTSTTVQTTESSILSATTTRYVPPPVTTITSPTSVATTEAVVPTVVTQTLTPARIFATATPSIVIIQSGSSTTLPASPTALAESMAPSFGSSVNPIALSQLIAALGQASTTSSQSVPSITAAPSINGSTLVGPMSGTLSGIPYSVKNATSTTYAVLNGTSTTYTVPYTGAAHPAAMPDSLGWLGGLLGLAVPMFL